MVQRNPRFMVHSAVTIMPREIPGEFNRVWDKDTKGFKLEPKLYPGEVEKELEQLAVDFKVSPISEVHFRSAFDEMRERCLQKARSAGLIIA